MIKLIDRMDGRDEEVNRSYFLFELNEGVSVACFKGDTDEIVGIQILFIEVIYLQYVRRKCIQIYIFR